MKALVFAALALVALALAPAASADPEVLPCYRDPCIDQGATVGSGGADAHACEYHQITMGTCVSAHAGTDRVVVGFGAGITRCTYGVDLDPLAPIAQCYF